MQGTSGEIHSREVIANRPIFICTTPRTGSSFLCEALEQTGCFGAIREWLHPANIDAEKRELDLDPAESTEAVLREAAEKGAEPTEGFTAKVSWQQFSEFILELRRSHVELAGLGDREILERYFPSAMFIYLYREDRLTQAISAARAFVEEYWLDYGQEHDRIEDFPFNYHLLHDSLAQLTAWDANWCAYWVAIKAEPLRVSYEEIFGNLEETIARLLAFCGCQPTRKFDRTKIRYRRMRNEVSDAWRDDYQSLLSRISENQSEGSRSALPPEAFKVSFTSQTKSVSAICNQLIRIPVGVRNESKHTWRVLGEEDGNLWMGLISRWFQRLGKIETIYSFTVPLPFDLGPSEECLVDLAAVAPPFPGSFELQVELEQRNFICSTRAGSYPLSVMVEVNIRAYIARATRYFESSDIDGEGEWLRCPWMGFIYIPLFPWVFHQGLGWLYCSKRLNEIGYWLYSPEFAWMWTSKEAFPFILRKDTEAWVYFDGDAVCRMRGRPRLAQA